MKRALILIVAVCMILTGCFLDEGSAKAEVSAGNHYLKGRVTALEACYTDALTHTPICVGVIEHNGTRRSGHIVGDVRIGFPVYKECTWDLGPKCDKNWHTSVGEDYLRGGLITEE
jgi:hypothetical protein